MVAAPASGSGKTTVATGLMAALRRAGRRVAVQGRARLHRPRLPCPRRRAAGPATSTPCWSASSGSPRCSGTVRPRRRGGRRGRDGPVRRAAGRRARLDGTRGQAAGGAGGTGGGLPRESRSVAALVHGFPSFDPASRVVGVVLNRVGSERHEPCCAPPATRSGCRCSARCHGDAELVVPSRHLGLVPAAEHGAAATRGRRHGRAGRAHVDLDAVVRLAEPIPPGPAWDPAAELAEGAPRRGRAGCMKAAFAAPYAPKRLPGNQRGAAGGGGGRWAGVHLRLCRARGAARGRGARGRRVRPAARRAPARRHGRARAPRRVPGGARAALSANAPLRAAVADLAAAGARCTPSAPGCSTCAGPGRAADVRRPAGRRPRYGPAHPRLPGRGGAR